jgi:hypothetical protein
MYGKKGMGSPHRNRTDLNVEYRFEASKKNANHKQERLTEQKKKDGPIAYPSTNSSNIIINP